MSKLRVPDFNLNWQIAPPSDLGEDDSDAELDAFFQQCKAFVTVERSKSSKRQYEYVVSGIFRDPSVTFDALNTSLHHGKEEDPFAESKISGDPIYSSPLYKEFIETLSHLTTTQRVEAYEHLTFTRSTVSNSRTALNFTNTVGIDERKSIDIYVHKTPGPLHGKCTLRELDGGKRSSASGDVVVRNLQTVVDHDMITVIQLYGYRYTKRMYVCGHVFTNNYGNPNHIEIAVLRHYLDCDPAAPASPNTLLVELRCIGDGEIETYRSLLRDYTRLLYKYVNFSLE